MRKEVFITGASGEVGHSLIHSLSEMGGYDIVAMDLREPTPELARRCKAFYTGDIRDQNFVQTIEALHCFDLVFHLAGLLSTRGEDNPLLAHEINVNGSLNVLNLAQNHSYRAERPSTVLFTSSIAVYGLRTNRQTQGPVKEHQHLMPRTMYGINKLYIEQLGRYFTRYLSPSGRSNHVPIDFRALRFPGLISAETVPSGGTSDYAPEMLHAVAQNHPYQCFVREDTTLPFMVMKDGIQALLQLAFAAPEALKQRIYNVKAFSVSAKQIWELLQAHFPNLSVSFQSNEKRQAIVDSWPDDVEDMPARDEWDWQPSFSFESAFEEYLIPAVKRRYQ